MTDAAVLRVARPTNDIDRLLPFYLDGLGFRLLIRFGGHDGFDGVALGHPTSPWHLEFVSEPGLDAPRAPTPEHLLALYLPDEAKWTAAVARMTAAGFAPVPAHNSYWDRVGKTFEDPDGYRVVLQNAAWTI